MEPFNLIVITDSQGGISKDGKIPWNFSEDLSYFKHKTMYSVLIMGRKTFETFSSPLPHRIHIVVSSSDSKNTDNVFFCKNFQQAYELALTFRKDIWVIGGKTIYETAMKHYSIGKIYRNFIHHDFDCDNKINWNCSFETIYSKELTNSTDGKLYRVDFQLCQKLQKNIEQQYLQLSHQILFENRFRPSRSGNVYSSFSHTLSHDLENGFPLLTTKKMFWKGIVEELLFFIRGETDSKKLSEKGVKIWEGNTTREFLDSLNLPYEEGQMGPMYGYQWRFFNKPLHQESGGVDQLANLVNEITRNPQSRRLVMTDFNPCQVNEGVLYPCHSLILQFYIHEKEISCTMYQRSADVFLGLPFNIASTSLLLHIIAKLTNLKPRFVHLHLGDCHIYEEHIPMIREQLSRVPYDFPTLSLPDFENLEQVEQSQEKDYKIHHYQHHSPIKAIMKI